VHQPHRWHGASARASDQALLRRWSSPSSAGSGKWCGDYTSRLALMEESALPFGACGILLPEEGRAAARHGWRW
jgi:L-rhamnose isomerase